VQFEEENEDGHEMDEENQDESEASWQKKLGSDDSSDDFRKPVDFGIEKEISYKLDKLNVTLMVGKDKDSSLNKSNLIHSTALNDTNKTDPKLKFNRHSFEESVPSSERDVLMDSPTRNYVKAVLGIRKNDIEDSDMKKSLNLDSLMDEKSIYQIQIKSQNELETQLKSFEENLERLSYLDLFYLFCKKTFKKFIL
jgi:hypothetical protein